MKIKEFIHRFNMASNAVVKVIHTPDNDMTVLSREQLAHEEPAYIMHMTLSGFTVCDNVVTIYARG